MKVDDLNNYNIAVEGVFKDKLQDLTECEFWILYELNKESNQNVLELAARRRRSFQTVARVSYNLRDRGFVTVDVSTKDARARILNLTEKGRKLYRRAANAIHRTTKELKEAV
ncbi:MAG: MarR family winged helix-turn-helix transcriptional regulator [Desulfobulbia bacterium]